MMQVLLEDDHSVDDNYHILHAENEDLRLNLLEPIKISRPKDSENLLNNKLILSSSPLINLFS